MKTIGIDISQIAYSGTGVARYTENLVDSLLKYDLKNKYIFFYSSLRQKIPDSIKKLITKKHRLIQYYFPPTLLEIIWNKLHIFPIENFVGHLDLFISSDWTEPPTSCKKITIIHDQIIEKYPETQHPKIIMTQKQRLKWVKKESDLIICDSFSTKDDVIKYLNIPENKLKVIYPGVSKLPTAVGKDSEILKQYNINKPYILSVGKLEPRKNIHRLINCFQKANINDLYLYIIGPKGWGNQENTTYQNVRLLGYVKNEYLSTLYKNALFFIYPSLYEGFGYPIIESMMSGCPVACSNTSSMKEIADGYAYTFDPNNEIEMTKAIVEMYNNSKLRKSLIIKGLKRYQDFSIKKFSEKLLNTINTFI